MLTNTAPTASKRLTASASSTLAKAGRRSSTASSAANLSSAALVHTGHASYRVATCAQLVRSRLNVRRKASGSVAELAALIRSQGLLQNLIGYEQVVDDVPTGMIEIVAGARRLEAVALLIAAGDFPEDYQITCLIVPMNEAIAISLAENSGREPMHPADTFEAMRELAARGAGIEDIALSFGVSALTVRRRLKLANVAPSFLALYRDDGITFEQMAALAICDDHATQLQAWESMDKWSRQPYQLRRLLTAQHIDIQNDPVARFVGVAAFGAAGGVVLRDLFSDANAGFIEDAGLLERLAAEQLASAARELAGEGWHWTDVRCRIERAELAQYAAVRTTRRSMSESEALEEARLEAAVAEVDAAVAAAEDEADLEPLYAQEAVLEAQLAALRRGLAVPHEGDKALAGALVTICENGKLVIHRNLIRPADKPRMQRDTGADGEGAAGKERERSVHSERLMRILTAHRTVALHAELMTRPEVALAVLAHGLVRQVFYPLSAALPLTHVRVTLPTIPDEVKKDRAAVVIRTRFDELKALLPEDGESGALLKWLLTQPTCLILDFLAFCTGAGVDTMQGREAACRTFDALAPAVALDMRQWWQPTVQSYFDHVTKATVLEVVQNAISSDATGPLLQLKRVALGNAAEEVMRDSGWVPDILRTGATD